jgi:soluble lytic murein transglycosylase
MSARYYKFKPGILIHGNKLWLSELLSIIIVGVILGSLFVMGLIAARNEIVLKNREQHIAKLKSEKIQLEYDLEFTKEQARIAAILYEFAGKRVPTPTIMRLAELVTKSSKQFGYDPLLLLAVIHVESVFNPKAHGKFISGTASGALGLMQLKPKTAMEMAKSLEMEIEPEDIFKPEINIILGVGYLTQLIARFKSFKLGLLAYNQGPGVILQNLHDDQPLSIGYYERVLTSYYRLKKVAAKIKSN